MSTIQSQKSSFFKESLPLKDNLITVFSKKIPLFDSNRKVVGLLNISFTLSEDEVHVMSFHVSQHQIALDNIVANLPGHVYWKDINGVYLGCNDKQAYSLGMSHGYELIGKTDFELPWKASSAQQFRQNDLYIMKKNKQIMFEEVSTFEGKPAVVLSYKSPLKDSAGKVIGVLGISLDITARKKAEEESRKAKEQLDRNNQAKAKFLRILQHDLRNKLTGILSFSDLLLDALDDKEQLKSGLNIIGRAGRSIIPTLDRINHYLSLETGHLKPYHSAFNLSSVLKSFEKKYKPGLAAKGLSMEFDLDPKLEGRFIGGFSFNV